MLEVRCESCSAAYQVDSRRLPPGGMRMRCPKCGHSFPVRPPAAQRSEASARSPANQLAAQPSTPQRSEASARHLGTEKGAKAEGLPRLPLPPPPAGSNKPAAPVARTAAKGAFGEPAKPKRRMPAGTFGTALRGDAPAATGGRARGSEADLPAVAGTSGGRVGRGGTGAGSEADLPAVAGASGG
ncbi:MAG: zinc-ribbon domain-containing protein, partial [Proteobacteria bacterium]|nr:zinc-ribbon domain-containing protein [Pseudomonadota bacterium]